MWTRRDSKLSMVVELGMVLGFTRKLVVQGIDLLLIGGVALFPDCHFAASDHSPSIENGPAREVRFAHQSGQRFDTGTSIGHGFTKLKAEVERLHCVRSTIALEAENSSSDLRPVPCTGLRES